MMDYLTSLAGGIIIGLSSWLMLASLGRVTGISGITNAALFQSTPRSDKVWRWFFLLGLVLGGACFAIWLNTPTTPTRSAWLLATAGLLVGFGTVLGSGCTSGHGVCGLGRRSVRSLIATCVFMAAGALTVWIAK